MWRRSEARFWGKPEERSKLDQHCFSRMDIDAPMKSSCDLRPDDAQMRETPKYSTEFVGGAMPVSASRRGR
jgi:hypothetical protein